MPRALELPDDATDRRVENWVAGNLDPGSGGADPPDNWRDRIAEPAMMLKLRPGAARSAAAPAAMAGGWKRLILAPRRGATVARLRDRTLVKEGDVREVAEELFDLIAAGKRRLAVDFAAVERASSLLAPVLAEASRLCAREGDGLLKIFRLRPDVAPIANLATPDGRLVVVADEAEALDGPWPGGDGPRALPDVVIEALAAGRGMGNPDPEAPEPTGSVRRARPRLVVMEGPLAGRSVPIRSRGIVLGRDPDCRLRLGSAQVSRRHAEVRALPDGGVRVRDLGSTNGTYLNGGRLGDEEGEMQPGDELRLGPFRFTVAEESAEADPPLPIEEAILDWLGVDRGREAPPAESDTALEMEAHASTLRREVMGGSLVVTPLEPQLVEERSVGALREELEEILGLPLPRRVVINLEHVGRIAPDAVGLLAAFHLRLGGSGGALRLCQANARVGLMLDQIRLTALMELHPSVEEAVLSPWGGEEPEDGPAPRLSRTV